MKIIQYTSVSGTGPATLEGAVKKYIEKGYQPFGSVYKWLDFFIQRMVKYEL